MDNTWEIMRIIDYYHTAIKNIAEEGGGYKDMEMKYEEAEEKYAQALRIQCNPDHYGYIMTREDFIEAVDSGSFIDYDGHGYFLNWDGEKQDYVHCDVKYLQQFDYPFVEWFNK